MLFRDHAAGYSDLIPPPFGALIDGGGFRYNWGHVRLADSCNRVDCPPSVRHANLGTAIGVQPRNGANAHPPTVPHPRHARVLSRGFAVKTTSVGDAPQRSKKHLGPRVRGGDRRMTIRGVWIDPTAYAATAMPLRAVLRFLWFQKQSGRRWRGRGEGCLAVATPQIAVITLTASSRFRPRRRPGSTNAGASGSRRSGPTLPTT